ncbi:Probable adenylate cyclase [Roseobacter sp. SK209-2-6]|uniref:adenylate/guanylate cyclase domain-containing protein n=1 Tax=Roseobacter sp. SK209-2-6 TaxID=388739 RepID=UPI0000F3D7D2|nr:adenylate/guanylate cyclase domain-containing protein [Roseobacter sp. SK209-2-6]EBA17520.1 Probable adenylate cyclase [Roseobacter sp. SK209-2-6]
MTKARTPDQALLRKAEVEIERLVAALRVGAALILLTAFVLAVKGGGEEVPDLYLRRQWIIAFLAILSYLVLGCFGYWLSTTGKFRSWMVWPAVTLDCLFMLVNSWASLANGGFPGEMTFMLPPIWLVPVVLGFTLLRFNPYLQAYCVFLIAGGLAYLTLWDPVSITPDIARRAEELVSTPPNIVRVVMIALGGAVLVIAAYRTRRLLHDSLVDAQARANLTRYLPAQMADQLAGGALEELRQGRQEEMVVMFTDVRGFTEWSEGRAPEEVGAYISEFRHRVSKAAGVSGGMIDKFIGDAAMILFRGGDAAQRSLSCVDALLQELRDWGAERQAMGRNPVRAGIGLHMGDVFSGVVGDEARLEYSVFGDTVNIAARLEELTKSAGVAVVTSAAVLEAAGTEPAREGWSQLPAMPLRGRKEPLALFGREQVDSAVQLKGTG